VEFPVSGRSDHRAIAQSEFTAVPLDGMASIMLRISVLAILLLTGCQSKQDQNPVLGQIQQIESPLQNTAEGMALAFTKPAQIGQ